MATHSSILAWKTLWTEEPRGPLSTGLQRVGHDLATEQQYFIIYTCQGMLRLLHILAIVNNAAVNIKVICLFRLMFLFSLDNYPEVE